VPEDLHISDDINDDFMDEHFAEVTIYACA
jgi:hypothetical protein